MSYIDGFVVPVPQDKVEEYRKIAEVASQVWIDHGALSYREAVAEDTDAKEMISFPQLANLKDGETVIFAYIEFKDRAHRDAVNAKVMEDERMKDMCPAEGGSEPPFDWRRMSYGGFKTIVSADK
ncbi:MAG: DUF1428 domain-containing protein [Pseudobdellovibrionaceae bacterium]